MDDALFKHPEELQAMPGAAIGGKAAGLLRLHSVGAPVPPWVVLPATAGIECTHTSEIFAALFAELSPNGEGLAVRSSGLSEDQSEASAAGIYETCFCASAAALPGAIERVLGSARGNRAAGYHGMSNRTAVDQDENTAGKAAPPSLIPPSGHGGMAVILQRRIAPVLSGVVFSAHPARARHDRVLIEAVHGECGALVDGTATPSRFEVDIASSTVVDLEPGAQGPDRLDEALATALIGWLLRLEDVFDAALDVEWAADASGLWLLQARPISRLAMSSSLRPPVPATSWFFDQRFHEPIHPITRTSLLPLILCTGVEEALRLRGMAVPQPLAFDFAGQVYVNLEAYHRLLRNLPSWLLTPDLRQLYPDNTCPARIPGLGLLWTGLPMLWRERKRVLGNVRSWDHFRDGLGARLAAISLPGADAPVAWQEAWRQLDALTEEFLCLHRWSIVLADYAYNVFLLTTALLPRTLRERARQRCLKRVRLVTADANAARATYTYGNGGDFLHRYGHRSASLDYATPTWAEELSGGEVEVNNVADPEEALPLARASTLVRLLEMREEQRFHWERILARQRALLVNAGRTLHARGLLVTPEHVWWLTWEELRAALDRSEGPNPARIAQRQRAHRIHAPVRRPTHLRPGTMDPDGALPKESGATLRGVGASPGLATGIAVVYQKLTDLPAQLPEGSILVLPCLDPAWTPLLRPVAGLVIERGGLLSHAAIIAREYGLPLVIGVPEATERIRTGESIKVDGDGGVVARV